MADKTNIIGIVVGSVAIVLGLAGLGAQYKLSTGNTAISYAILVEIKKLHEISDSILVEVRGLRTETEWTTARLTVRENISSLEGYKKDILIRDAYMRDVAISSCLKLTTKGERLLKELMVTGKINEIKIKKGNASLDYVLITILSTDYIQSKLLEYSKEHEKEADNFTPHDLTVVLGGVIAYYNQYW